MRNTKTKTKKIGILALWLTLCLLGQAQTSGIWTMTEIASSTKSIIREWQAKYALVYSSDAGVRNIHVMEHGNTVVRSASINDEIRDMEILGDTLYYCGNTSAGVPIVGYFAITDLFSGMINIEKLFFTTATFIHPRKMEVFGVRDGVHIVLVADEITASGEYRILADVVRNYPTGANSMAYYIATDQIEFFDDVAVTDNYVVTSEHKHLAGSIYMRMFEKPTMANAFGTNGSIFSSTFPTPIYNDIYYYPCEYDIIYSNYDLPVWITATTGDSIAIACMSQSKATNIYGFTLKQMDINTMSWIIGNDVFVPLGATLNPAWNVCDLRYSDLSDKILLLQDLDNPMSATVERSVTVIENSMPNIITGYFDVINAKIHSVDKVSLSPNIYMASGAYTTKGHLAWEVNAPGIQNCFIPVDHSPKLSSCKMSPFLMSICDHSRTVISSMAIQIPVFGNKLSVKCY